MVLKSEVLFKKLALHPLDYDESVERYYTMKINLVLGKTFVVGC